MTSKEILELMFQGLVFRPVGDWCLFVTGPHRALASYIDRTTGRNRIHDSYAQWVDEKTVGVFFPRR